VEAGDALDDNSLVAEPKSRENVWMNTEHYLLNAVIAAAIFCCFCVIIGYVGFLYCRHQKKQKETEQRAKIFLQQAMNEGGTLWHERLNRRDYQPFNPASDATTLDMRIHSVESTQSILSLSSEQTPLLTPRHHAHSEDEQFGHQSYHPHHRPQVDRIDTV